MNSYKITISILSFLCIILFLIFNQIMSRKNKKQLEKSIAVVFVLIIIWLLCDIIQIICMNKFNLNPLYFDYIAYISVCFLPIAFLFFALIFAKTKINFKKVYCLLFIVPIISILVLWSNDFHHLFYIKYSTKISETIYGNYVNIHYIYTYFIFAVSLFILMKYSIKNSGIFSRQALYIFIAAIIPILTNILGFTNIISMSVYITPMTFAFTIMLLTHAIFRLNLFRVTPIALRIIVNRISDSFVVLNDIYEISDFNDTFVNTFKIKDPSTIRGISFEKLLVTNNFNTKKFSEHIKKLEAGTSVDHFQIYIKNIKKYFNVEITQIAVNSQSLGILVLFKDITQHIEDMQSLKNNQSILMEQERLASLGQMVGGIAHNLKTPIMSIAGASEGLKDLVNEFDASIGNPIVNDNDFHDIAKDMKEWLTKINSYTEYMSDILTAVKGQAVTLTEQEQMDFTVGELFKRINILMKHELKKAVVYLNMSMKLDENIIINGDVNNLVQVINNMISNSIQAYEGKPEQQIDLIAWINENNNIVITVKDYGPGLPDKVKKKLFKEMVTTKGKNGTGLGLYMSYSNIRAHFNGNITVESETGRGTTFNIIIP